MVRLVPPFCGGGGGVARLARLPVEPLRSDPSWKHDDRLGLTIVRRCSSLGGVEEVGGGGGGGGEAEEEAESSGLLMCPRPSGLCSPGTGTWSCAGRRG